MALQVTCGLSAQEPAAKNERQVKDWVFLENAEVRAGLLRSHGGAIAHLSTPGSDFNVINHHDHGRLIQQSYYGDADGSLWAKKEWRYNPVQGGSYRGKASRVTEFQSTKTTAYAKTIPRHWASGQLLDECTMEQWVELDGPIVKVRYRFAYNGKRAHEPHHQELPAVFVDPKLATLVTYKGYKPWTGGELTSKKPGWPNEPATLAENWAAYVDDAGQGVGIFVPGVVQATCYRFQGRRGSACSYLAPIKTFALTPELEFSYTAYFTLGDVETIRSRFKELHQRAAGRSTQE